MIRYYNFIIIKKEEGEEKQKKYIEKLNMEHIQQQ